MGSRTTRTLNRLASAKLKTLSDPGRHSDGGGLYLVIEPTGSKRWAFIFRWKPHKGTKGPGRLREMGLGSFNAVSLARAREKAAEARGQVADGIDPIAARKASQAVPTFGEAADAFIEARSSELRSAKSVARWERALKTYAADLRPISIDAITTDDVLGVLNKIWTTKPESAQKARGVIEAVLDAAKAKGHRKGENPARWKGHLDHLLPRRQKLSRGHHAAMPYADLPAFIGELRQREATAALGLEFLILTAARSGEVLGARWGEIDLKAKVWTVPAGRTKGGREHRVPLSARAIEILEAVAKIKAGDHVFPGQVKKPVKEGEEPQDAPLSTMAFEMLLRRMKREITTHGFRSSFRDWAGEATSFPRELAEAALAHTVGDETERAYRRADALERRRKMMDAWAGYCEPKEAGSNVRPMARRSAKA